VTKGDGDGFQTVTVERCQCGVAVPEAVKGHGGGQIGPLQHPFMDTVENFRGRVHEPRAAPALRAGGGEQITQP
jgi:hypothetical protein